MAEGQIPGLYLQCEAEAKQKLNVTILRWHDNMSLVES